MQNRKTAERLYRARCKMNLTIEQAADAIGITAESLRAYEEGERMPRDEVKIRLSRLYGVPLAIFYEA